MAAFDRATVVRPVRCRDRSCGRSEWIGSARDTQPREPRSSGSFYRAAHNGSAEESDASRGVTRVIQAGPRRDLPLASARGAIREVANRYASIHFASHPRNASRADILFHLICILPGNGI